MKPLNPYQLIQAIRKSIPGGRKKGGQIIRYLKQTGYIYETAPNTYAICHGVKVTEPDIESIVNDFAKHENHKN